ncbi:IS110 family transposase [Nocardia asiatica]|uniref:IS110 family transposase n=1 Tax=Nocardia asiatica TaxID=209252 RepID=UPI0024537E80|nr:IS110 family transposase [Nocardia asiatica]
MKGSTCSMTSSCDSAPIVYVGVDTHTDTHHVAVVSEHGKKRADREFSTTADGYAAIERWIASFGEVARIGIEGSGSYGVELARYLHTRGYNVAEVPRPNRRLRRAHGKTDTIDAYAAARRLLDGSGVTAPKLRNSAIEAVRALRVARHGAVKATTAALNALRGLVTTCPEELRSQLRGLSRAKLVATCAAFRPDTARLTDPAQATKLALRSLAVRVREAQDQADQLERHLHKVLEEVAPKTLSVFALGPDTAAALVISIGDNRDRLTSEAAFARLCGVAPIPASSGKTVRHRLHRGGDRQANQALHIAVIVRLRYDQRTRDYAARRTTEGKTKPEIIRCLKRYLAREVFQALRADFPAPAPA